MVSSKKSISGFHVKAELKHADLKVAPVEKDWHRLCHLGSKRPQEIIVHRDPKRPEFIGDEDPDYVQTAVLPCWKNPVILPNWPAPSPRLKTGLENAPPIPVTEPHLALCVLYVKEILLSLRPAHLRCGNWNDINFCVAGSRSRSGDAEVIEPFLFGLTAAIGLLSVSTQAPHLSGGEWQNEGRKEEKEDTVSSLNFVFIWQDPPCVSSGRQESLGDTEIREGSRGLGFCS